MATRNLCVALAILLIGGLSPAWAGLVEVSYLETELGGGVFNSEFFITNSSHRNNGFGVWNVQFYLADPIENLSLPDGWIFQEVTSAGFFEIYSDKVGIFPDGTDIAPGETLGGFLFETNFSLSLIDLKFLALLDTYSIDENGLSIYIESTGFATPVPEPATLILFAAGLAGTAFYHRRMRFF